MENSRVEGGRTSTFLLSYDMVFFITSCSLLSWFSWYEHRQLFHSSFFSSETDSQQFQGKVWTVDDNGWWIQTPAQPWRCGLSARVKTTDAKVCAQCNARRAWASKTNPPAHSSSSRSPPQPLVKAALGMQTRQQTALTSHFAIDSHGIRRIHGISFERQASPRRQVCAQCAQ